MTLRNPVARSQSATPVLERKVVATTVSAPSSFEDAVVVERHAGGNASDQKHVSADGYDLREFMARGKMLRALTNNQKGQRKAPRKGKGRSRGRGQPSNLPPALDMTVLVNHTFRFVSTSATLTGVSVNDLLGACGCVAYVANTSSRALASSVKINSITIWPAAGGQASLEWVDNADTAVRDRWMNTDLPTGITETAPCLAIPPKDSLASFWHGSQTGTLFNISTTVGSTVDVNLSFTLSNAIAGPVITVSVAAVGTIFYYALDGPSTNRYPPAVLPTGI